MKASWVSKKQVLVIIVLLVLLAALAAVASIYKSKTTSEATAPSCKYLISYGISNLAFPSYVASHLSTIEQNYPYDGQGIQTSAQGQVLKPTTLSYSTAKSELQPLFDVTTKPTKLKHNMFQLLLHDPGDLFDDTGWNVAIQNAGTFAQALKDLDDSGFGVDGVLFDNEGPYGYEHGGTTSWGGYWNYPRVGESADNCTNGCPYIRTSHTLEEYQAKAALRGNQIMVAMIQKFPDMKFMFMHSSNNSCTDPNDLHNNVYAHNELLGSFALGLAEATVGTGAKVVDGGEESYGYTTEAQFTKSYDFRNSGMLTYLNPHTGQLACSFIPTADKTGWSSLFNKGFGLYNKEASGGQSVSTIGNSTRLALSKSDNYVWFYVEGVTTIGNTQSYPQIDAAWTSAITTARNTVVNDPVCDSGNTSPTSTSPTSTTSPTAATSPTPTTSPASTVCEPAAPNNLSGTAASSTQINLAWRDNSSNENGFSVERKLSTDSTYGEIYNSRAANITSYQDTTNIVAGRSYNYRVRAYNGCGSGVSVYSPVATVTAPSALCLPTAPTNLTATGASRSQINISWSDNSSNENGFSIERSRSSSSGFVQIATVGTDASAYQDQGLSSNTTYYYRVRAFNGCGSGVSAYTNTTSAKTKKRWWLF